MILLVFAFVLFCFSPYLEPYEPYRTKLVATGLAFWVASLLFKF